MVVVVVGGGGESSYQSSTDVGAMDVFCCAINVTAIILIWTNILTSHTIG